MTTAYLAPGTILKETYRIRRFISSGGFGCTYEGEHIMLGNRIAIKEFFVKDFCNRNKNNSCVEVATDSKVELIEKLRGKFIEEARLLNSFNHRGIVHVSDVFEENGTAYYVMDYIDGQSLHDKLLRVGHLDEQQAVDYILQVADALEYVHNHNRLHLDIKPGNIMVGADNRAILIDFGISKHYDDETGENTSTMLGVNTPGYAPIEQMLQTLKTFNPATDIYALGATFYKLLTGVTPPNSAQLMGEEQALQPLPDTISPQVRNAVMKAMQIKRKDRPQSVKEFRELLSDVKSAENEKTYYASGSAETVVEEKKENPVSYGSIKYSVWGFEGSYSGNLKNNVPEGHGQFTFADGDTYQGDWHEGKIHGNGIYTFADGSRYEGSWKDGIKSGCGLYVFANGDSYSGEYLNGNRHGQGTYTWGSGRKYVGQWAFNRRNGFGTLYDRNGSVLFQGQWRDDSNL